jgi:two-component system cell cycle response regulator
MSVKILTVDDSKTIRMVVAKAFKPFDCEIIEAANGMEGLAAAVREKPELIILDITMPVMDGVEMLTKLKADASIKNIPVIMLTAEAGRENVLNIAKLGIRDYVVKPFKEEQLIEKAGRIVQLQAKSSGKVTVKTVNDPVRILVIDDKPTIIQQLSDGLTTDLWKVVGKADTTEGLEDVSAEIPDVILVSLTLPGDAGFKMLQDVRSKVKPRSIPMLGMCIKTDQDTLNRAEKSGFVGTVTKPIDVESLQWRLTRVMNLDTSPRYYSISEGIQFVKFPPKVTSQVVGEVERYLQGRINEMVDSGMNKFLLDLSAVTEPDPALMKTILSATRACQELGIFVRLATSPIMTNQLKSFTETSDISVEGTMEEAKVLLLAAK